VFRGLHFGAVHHLVERREHRDHVLLAVASDSVEVLEAETDWIDQPVTCGASWVRKMDGQPLAVGHWLFVGSRRQCCVHSCRRRRNDLAQEMLPHEDAPLRRRRIGRFAG